MRGSKATKLLIDIITFIIGFNVANYITNSLGVKYEKFLSFEFALRILIVTIMLIIVDFLMSKIMKE